MGDWQPIETAPKDENVLVWYDHEADPYQDPQEPDKLTDYAAWAEIGDFVEGRGVIVARLLPRFWESVDEYGAGYWLPAAWFAFEHGDYERVCNPTHWMPLPNPPSQTQQEKMINKLTTRDRLADRIEELRAENERLRDEYRYIGKDGKPILARELEDQRDEAREKLAKAVELGQEECPFWDGSDAYNDWWHDRRTTLKELTSSVAVDDEVKGGKDE